MIPGLPADLPHAARAYAEALPPGRYVSFSMTPLDRTGVPAWKVVLFPDDPGVPGFLPSGYGYGVTDEEAIIGALAELAEVACPSLRLVNAPRWTGSYLAMRRERGERGVVDPLTLCLPAGSPVDRNTELAWVQAVRAATGEPVLVPIDIVALGGVELPPGYRPFTQLITNGLGAGPDIDWALGHGVLELLQRDGNGLLFRAMDAGVVLDLPSDLDGETRALLDRLAGLGIRVIPKFATDEFGLSNLYVVGYDVDGRAPAAPIMVSACGEACDPDRERALRKAVLEFCSARARKTCSHGPLEFSRSVAPPGYLEDFMAAAGTNIEWAENRALRAMTEWSEMDAEAIRGILASSVLSERSHKAFAELPKTEAPDTRARGRIARERLEAAGFDVLYVDCSPPGGTVGVVRAIVPGLEVETMSYHRIGERNARKLIERDNPLIRFGEPTDTLRPVRLTPEALDRFGEQPLLDTALVDAVVGPLYPLYREPEAHFVGHRLAQLGQAA